MTYIHGTNVPLVLLGPDLKVINECTCCIPPFQPPQDCCWAHQSSASSAFLHVTDLHMKITCLLVGTGEILRLKNAGWNSHFRLQHGRERGKSETSERPSQGLGRDRANLSRRWPVTRCMPKGGRLQPWARGQAEPLGWGTRHAAQMWEGGAIVQGRGKVFNMPQSQEVKVSPVMKKSIRWPAAQSFDDIWRHPRE